MFGLGLGNLARLCHELGTMVEAGLTVPRALESLRRRTFRPRVRRVLDRLIFDVAGGASFCQALDRQPGTFPLLMRTLVRAGEESGNIEAVLARLGSYFDLQREIRKKIIMRMIYPTAVVIMSMVILTLTGVVRGTLQDTSGTSTFSSRLDGIIAALFHGFLNGVFLVAGIVIAVVVFVKFVYPTRIMQEILFCIPMLGRFVKYSALARFSWCMELMLRAGVNIRDALTRSIEATNNGAFIARKGALLKDIINGATVTEAMDRTRLFPPEYMEFVATGEETGSMEPTFARVAKLYFDRAETALHVFASTVAWTVFAIVAVLVAIIVVTFYTGYFNAALQGMN
jgi:type II secretory pathway component PulF